MKLKINWWLVACGILLLAQVWMLMKANRIVGQLEGYAEIARQNMFLELADQRTGPTVPATAGTPSSN